MLPERSVESFPRPKIRCALFGHAWRRAFSHDYQPFLMRCWRCGTKGPVDPQCKNWD